VPLLRAFLPLLQGLSLRAQGSFSFAVGLRWVLWKTREGVLGAAPIQVRTFQTSKYLLD